MVQGSTNVRVNTLPLSMVQCSQITNLVTTPLSTIVLMTDVALLVLVYDGWKNLNPVKYWDKLYDRELEVGTTVTLLFSIKKGTLPENAQQFRRSKEMVGVYVNILAVVILADPTDTFCQDTSLDPETVHGVDSLPRLPGEEVAGESEEEDADDDNADGLKFSDAYIDKFTE